MKPALRLAGGIKAGMFKMNDGHLSIENASSKNGGRGGAHMPGLQASGSPNPSPRSHLCQCHSVLLEACGLFRVSWWAKGSYSKRFGTGLTEPGRYLLSCIVALNRHTYPAYTLRNATRTGSEKRAKPHRNTS